MEVEWERKRLQIYLLLGVLGVVMFIVTLTAYIQQSDGPFVPVWDLLGHMNFFLFFIGAIIGIYFLYFTYRIGRFTREFHRLMKTESKAKFVRNQDRIEFLAWQLGDVYEEDVAEKMNRFNIKRKK